MSIPLIRKLLKENPDGMTARELAVKVYGDPTSQAAVNKSLESMYEAYRDRWQPVEGKGRSQWAAVWCVVEVPEHCPRPEGDGA